MRKTDFHSRLAQVVRCTSLASLWFFFAFAAPVWAAESAGVILALTGKVEIVRGSATLSPANRTELLSGDTVATGEGQVQIRFTDGGMLTLYRDTRFAVDDYRYGKGKDDRAHFSLLNGLMHTLTGQMDKQNYQIKTRLANLGVRGTEFSVGLADVLRISVDQGRVVVSNAGGSVQVGAGQSLTVTGQNKMSQPSTGGKIDLRTQQGPGAGRPGAGGPPPPGGGQGTGASPPHPPPPGTQAISQRPLPGGQQMPPAGQQTPPAGQQQTPPTGQQQTPPTGQQQTPPTGQQQTPPTGQQQTPPTGQQQTPPTGQQQTPPTGQQQTPPTGQQQTPPTGQQQTPPAGQQTPPAGQQMPPGPR